MPRPNIILIVIDDFGWRDLASYGSSFYETPHLDRLAGQGMLFTDAYASSPVCSPSRASLMTGKSPARVGITQYIGGRAQGRLCDVPYFHGLPTTEVSIATALSRAGYQTWHVGKWHLGDESMSPTRHGFEVNRGGCGWGMPSYGYVSPYRIPTLEDGPPGEYLTDRLTDEAIRLVRERKPERPFFLNFWHYAVHVPIQAPQVLVDKHRARAKALGLDRQEAIVQGPPLPTEHLQGRYVQRRVIQSDPVYAAMIDSLDTNIGRLLATLDEQGLTDDTLVVFTSDNGGLSTAEGSPTCNLPLAEGKGWMYEGGTRVCQLVRWPGVITPGSRTEVPTSGADWYPTFLSAAGLPSDPEQHADGTDLMPLLRGADLPQRDLFWHYPHYSNQGGTPACSIRSGDWKLVHFFEDEHHELYQLRDDIGERHDLSDRHPQRAAAMLERLQAWQVEVQAIKPRINRQWLLPVGCHAPEV